MNSFLKKISRGGIDGFKQLDKLTGFWLGNIIRKLTNVNSPTYWDQRFQKSGDTIREYPYEDLAEYLPAGQTFSLIDIGSALGDGCRVFKRRFPTADIQGADWSEVAVAKARRLSPDLKFLHLNILIDVLPQTYDYITMASTIEHFNDPFCVVDRCLRFTKKALLIYTPYTPTFKNARLYSQQEHRFLFNESTFRNYNHEILKITEKKPTGYQYIIYRIIP
jgi:2-polyprenyl-3-methyl-5-hydroxy-6-metoxy-1,4-benzoquinol methylase